MGKVTKTLKKVTKTGENWQKHRKNINRNFEKSVKKTTNVGQKVAYWWTGKTPEGWSMPTWSSRNLNTTWSSRNLNTTWSRKNETWMKWWRKNGSWMRGWRKNETWMKGWRKNGTWMRGWRKNETWMRGWRKNGVCSISGESSLFITLSMMSE